MVRKYQSPQYFFEISKHYRGGGAKYTLYIQTEKKKTIHIFTKTIANKFFVSRHLFGRKPTLSPAKKNEGPKKTKYNLLNTDLTLCHSISKQKILVILYHYKIKHL